MRLFLILLPYLLPCVAAHYFVCPQKCQCYEDLEERSRSMHLICKWDQINSTSLWDSLGAPERVRTLTIRCPHFSRKPPVEPPVDIFYGLRNLDRLEIDRCKIKHLPPGIFEGLSQLYSLIIKHAKIPELPQTIFGPLENLMTLDLTGNDLKIEPYALGALHSLMHLDLSNNSINFLANTLVTLGKLKVLTMDHNKLTNIDFRRLPVELTDLSVRNNHINTIHYVPTSAANLKRLDLSGNQLDFVAASGSVNVLPPGLKTVDLSHNRVAYVQEGALQALNKLMILDLKNNSLSDLKVSAVINDAKHRMRMFISKNPFQCTCSLNWILHPTTKHTPMVMDESDIECSHLVDTHKTMTLIKADQEGQLLCKYNQVCSDDCECCENYDCSCRSSCPSGCKCFRSFSEKSPQNLVMCEKIRLDHLKDIPKEATELRLISGDWRTWSPQDIGHLKGLRVLNISGSHLDSLPKKTLSQFPNLTSLDLSNNNFTEFPADELEGIRQLSVLHLAGNPIKEVTLRALQQFDTLREISVGGNAAMFKCDCDTPSTLQRWLRLKKNREKVINLSDLYCELEPFGRILIIDTLPTNDSFCDREKQTTTAWLKFVSGIDKFGKDTDMPVPTVKATLTTVEIMDSTESGEFDPPTLGSTWYETFKTTWPATEPHTTESTTEEPTTILTTTEPTTKRTSTTTSTSVALKTTRAHKRRHWDDEPQAFYKSRIEISIQDTRIINALIFILFVCVIVLVIAIGFTIYYRSVKERRKIYAAERVRLKRSNAIYVAQKPKSVVTWSDDV